MLTFRARNHREWIAEVHRFISRLDKAIRTNTSSNTSSMSSNSVRIGEYWSR